MIETNRISELKFFLDELQNRYNNKLFIATDPIQVPHKFYTKEDIEISAFLVSIISWGQRKTIINNGYRILNFMDNQPYDFILNHSKSDLIKLNGFCHRTFNSSDLKAFIKVLKYIYLNEGGLEGLFYKGYSKSNDLKDGIIYLRHLFEQVEIPVRTLKHVANVNKGSSAKRINMFLRWMIRKDNKGVDFGIWESIPASALYIPLDIHTGTSARENGLLVRKQNDWKAVEELTSQLRLLDPDDPIKYDFALFGIGAFKD